MSDSIPEPTTQLLNGEKLIGLAEAARSLPGYRGKAGMDPSTLSRWITQGAKRKNGDKVKLEAVRIGNRWLTSREAMARFAASLTGTRSVEKSIPSPSAQTRASKKAGQLLEKMGA